MKKAETTEELQQKIELLEIQVKHMQNDLMLTRQEHKESTQNYFALYSNIEEKIKKAKEEANAANRVRSEFLANISHELRTPLNSILGFSQILKETAINESQEEFVDSIIKSGSYLLLLINDLIDISQLDAGKIQIHIKPVDMRSMIEEVFRYYRFKANEKGLELSVEIDEVVPGILYLDKDRVQQIFNNLVGNAVKFTNKGMIKISVSSKPVSDDTSLHNLNIVVSDSGIGIEKEEQKHIFDSFRQQDGKDTKKYGGTGLGLAITKRLVQMMKGDIDVLSEPGKGSQFTVTLLGIKTESASEITGSDLISINANTKNILVADDDFDNIKIFKIFLRDSGCNIIEAKNGNDAIKKIDQFKPDLVFMDLNMPEMNGFEVVEYIRKKNKYLSIPFVAVSGFVDCEIKQRALNSGFIDYILKPFGKQDILDIISKFNNKQTSPQDFQENSIEQFTSAQINKFPELKIRLENELTEKWQELRQTMVLSDIHVFGSEIEYEGEQSGLINLKNWGRKLKKYSKNFQIDELNKILKEFPEVSKALIEKIDDALNI